MMFEGYILHLARSFYEAKLRIAQKKRLIGILAAGWSGKAYIIGRRIFIRTRIIESYKGLPC